MIPAFKIRSRTIRYSRMLFFKKTFVTGKSKISLGTDFLILILYVNGCYKWYVARGDAVDFCILWERSAVTKVRVK